MTPNSDQRRIGLRRASATTTSRSNQTSFKRDTHEQINLESQNVIISTSNWPLGCLIHVVPVLAVLAIMALNFQGYFLGTQFTGVTNSTSQSIALSSLQVTAKLLEIIVITSLGYLIWDIVHYFLFFDEAGLPLALTGIRLSFSNIFYLLSPSFWSGIRAFRCRKTQLLVVFLLLSCGLIATFIGPAAALLLIPSIRSNWLAGSYLWRAPPNQPLTWSSQLDASSLDTSVLNSCLNPSEEVLTYPYGSHWSCIWAATSTLGSVVIDQLYPWSGSAKVNDDFYGRYISWDIHKYSNWSATRAWSSTSATNLFASKLLADWSSVLSHATNLQRQYNRYTYRDQSGTQTNLQGMLAPVAQTTCRSSMGEFPTSNPTSYAFPVPPSDDTVSQGRNDTYLLSATISHNTSDVRTYWVPKPTSASEIEGVDSSLKNVTLLPSAFLIAQIPRSLWTSNPDDMVTGFVITCSVDAYWTNGNQYTAVFDEQHSNGVDHPATYTDIDRNIFDIHGRPDASKLSPRINLDNSWLEYLTPTLNRSRPGINLSQASTGFTSVSKIFNSVGSVWPNKNQSPNDIGSQMAWRFELFSSLLVVDGIARTWNGSLGDISGLDPAHLLAAGGDSPQIGQDLSMSERTEFLWTVTISGYAYAVDSTAYILAVIVLFSYVFFAVGHTCFTFYKKWNSNIWLNVPDIVALAHRSPPSALLNDISGGTGLGDSTKLLMKLRVANGPGNKQGVIHLLATDHQQNPKDGYIKRYNKLEKGERYR